MRYRAPWLGFLIWIFAVAQPAHAQAEFDYPDRPKASPSSGFIIQSRAGEKGNFEVVLPWPDGGLAHFWRENDAPGFPWRGPKMFGSGRYVGASLIESGFTAVNTGKGGMKNLEVIAITSDGAVEHWSRDNGNSYAWRRVSVIAGDGVGTPALVYTGAKFKTIGQIIDLESHGNSSFFMAYAKQGGGFEYWRFRNDVDHNNAPYGKPTWFRLTGRGTEATALKQPDDHHYTGVGIALTTLYSVTDEYIDWKSLHTGHPVLFEGREPESGQSGHLVTVVSRDGGLAVFHGSTGSSLREQQWRQSVVLGVPGPGGVTDFHAYRGNACLFQGDFGLTDNAVTISLTLQPKHFGNLELFVPAKTGGIYHSARDNGDTNHDSKPLTEGWGAPERIGTAIYDEVSCFQSNFGGAKSGNMQMIARTRDQKGFDFFWRGDDAKWHGPEPVGLPAVGGVGTSPGNPGLGVITQPVVADPATPRPMGTPDEIIASLAAANIDFSRPEASGDLREWMADPINTPYPAIGKSLLRLFGQRRLTKPAFIDVVAYNYEPDQDARLPRRETDVDAARLKIAVIKAFNTRNGTNEIDFDKLFSH